jgi:Anaphase-promoting complex subunit 4 WD40 domain
MKYKCFNPIQSVTIKSGSCILCPSMDLIAFFGSDQVIVQRTVSWQRVAVVGYSHVQALVWSPDGSLLALARKEGGYVLSNVELGMTEGEDESVVHRLLTGPPLDHLVWARIGNPHVGWIVTQQERERDAMWR